MQNNAIRNKFLGIEFGRGLAALMVVAGHSQLAGLPDDLAAVSWIATKLAVEFFFILSGFIIFYIHRADIGCPPRAIQYGWRRLVRIFPTYWLVLFIDVGLHLMSRNHSEIPTKLSDWLHQVFLLPGGEPYISVAWTLRHELLFYCFFLILIMNWRAGIILFASWLAAILYALYFTGWHPENWPPSDTLTSPVNLGFFVGMAIASLSRFKAPSMGWKLHDHAATICFWFGAVSYPLYLIHPTIFFISGGIFRRLGFSPNWQEYLVFVVLLSLATATAMAFLYERPALSRLQTLGRLKRT